MDQHAIEFYSDYSEKHPHGHFHRVIPLHEEPGISWEEAKEIAPSLCRGWYELAGLPVEDRVEFTRDFWLAKLPYCPHMDESLTKFFACIDDIGIFLTQQKYEDPFQAHIVYSLESNSGFFHGECPANEREIINLQKDFPSYILPADYLAFLQIHNGFAKLTDTGITPSKLMKETYQNFQKIIREGQEPIATADGTFINPASLIPFYESFGMPFFQCFWGEWYPDQEMGNVYYSVPAKKITTCRKKGDCDETMAFENFTDWLMFYLEKIG
jgi:hypothetical protein